MECYVNAHHPKTGEVVSAIKNGLEKDGLGDLVLHVSGSDAPGTDRKTRQLPRRDKFSKTDIYLHKVLLVDGEEVRDLDYETDILACVDWTGFDAAASAAKIPENAHAAESQVQRIELSDGDTPIEAQRVARTIATTAFDPSFAVRVLSDLVPNPFVCRQIVANLIKALTDRGFDERRIADLLGQKTPSMARHYSRSANLAEKNRETMATLEKRERKARENCQTFAEKCQT